MNSRAAYVPEMGGDCTTSRPGSYPRNGGGANRRNQAQVLRYRSIKAGRSNDDNSRQAKADNLGGGTTMTSEPEGSGGGEFVQAAMKVADVVMVVVEGIDLAIGLVVVAVASVLVIGSVGLVVTQAVVVVAHVGRRVLR